MEQALSEPGFTQLVAELKDAPEGDLLWQIEASTGTIVFKNGEWFVFSSYYARDDDLKRCYIALGKGSNGVWYKGTALDVLRGFAGEVGQLDSLEAFLAHRMISLVPYEP